MTTVAKPVIQLTLDEDEAFVFTSFYTAGESLHAHQPVLAAAAISNVRKTLEPAELKRILKCVADKVDVIANWGVGLETQRETENEGG